MCKCCWIAGLVGLAVLWAGCSRGPKTIPASGLVTVGGKPLPSASVMFYVKGGPPASAKTDSSGAFRLSALPGENTVTVTAFEVLDPGSDIGPSSTGAGEKLRWIAPERYSRVDASDLRAKVTPGGENHFGFELPAK